MKNFNRISIVIIVFSLVFLYSFKKNDSTTTETKTTDSKSTTEKKTESSGITDLSSMSDFTIKNELAGKEKSEMTTNMVIEITDANFDAEVTNSDKPVVVFFTATWCGPCKINDSYLEEIANEYDGKFKVGKIDFDNNPNLGAKYEIRSIPVLIIFKDGQLVYEIVGPTSKSTITYKMDMFVSTSD